MIGHACRPEESSRANRAPDPADPQWSMRDAPAWGNFSRAASNTERASAAKSSSRANSKISCASSVDPSIRSRTIEGPGSATSSNRTRIAAPRGPSAAVRTPAGIRSLPPYPPGPSRLRRGPTLEPLPPVPRVPACFADSGPPAPAAVRTQERFRRA